LEDLVTDVLTSDKTLSAYQNLSFMIARVKRSGAKATGILLGPGYSFLRDMTEFQGLPVAFDETLASDALVGNFKRQVTRLRKCSP
jgi:hypothetical protein